VLACGEAKRAARLLLQNAQCVEFTLDFLETRPPVPAEIFCHATTGVARSLL